MLVGHFGYMSEIFPKLILNLPEADVPLEGVKAYLSQSDSHQIIFMEFEKDAELSEHSHEEQYGIILEGKIDIWINDVKHTFRKGDRYLIPRGVKHSVKIYAGYADITFFNQKDRYKIKQ